MKKDLELICTNFQNDLGMASNVEELEELRKKYILKNGLISSMMAKIRNVPQEERPELGKLIHEKSKFMRESIDGAVNDIKKNNIQNSIDSEKININAPAKKINLVQEHTLISLESKINEFFLGLGFEVTEINNKEILPSVEIKILTEIDDKKLPLAAIAPRKVLDNSSFKTKHNIEGVVISPEIKFSDLKGTMQSFVDFIFEKNRNIRFKTSYSNQIKSAVEVDIISSEINNDNISESDYVNIIKCGIIPPHFLTENNIDFEKYSGFAFYINLENILQVI